MKIKRKNLGVFSIFVVFTTILWFFNALNQTYQTDLRVMVKYVNMPRSKVNISNLPQSITATVRALGYNIVKYKLKNSFVKTKLDIATQTLNYLNSNDTNNFYILTNKFTEQVEAQLGNGMRVEFLKPDTLHFRFTTFDSKKVPVRVNCDLTVKSQFVLKDEIWADPDSVVVGGPMDIIDTISFVETKMVEASEICENVILSAEILPMKHITFVPDEVKLNVSVEEYTERKFDIFIEPENVPDSLYLHLFPSTVSVVCKVGYEDYSLVNASDFSASVDFFSIFEGDDGKLSISVEATSENIYGYSFYPNYVEYVVENK